MAGFAQRLRKSADDERRQEQEENEKRRVAEVAAAIKVLPFETSKFVAELFATLEKYKNSKSYSVRIYTSRPANSELHQKKVEMIRKKLSEEGFDMGSYKTEFTAERDAVGEDWGHPETYYSEFEVRW